ALEDRCLPTIAFIPHFGVETVQGFSDGMQDPPVHFIFSGSYWNTAPGQADEAAMLRSAYYILTGPYLSGLTQYGSDGKASFSGSWNDPGTVPANPGNSTLDVFLQTSIGHYGSVPGNNDPVHAPIYVVVSDPSSSAQDNGGSNALGLYALPGL